MCDAKIRCPSSEKWTPSNAIGMFHPAVSTKECPLCSASSLYRTPSCRLSLFSSCSSMEEASSLPINGGAISSTDIRGAASFTLSRNRAIFSDTRQAENSGYVENRSFVPSITANQSGAFPCMPSLSSEKTCRSSYFPEGISLPFIPSENTFHSFSAAADNLAVQRISREKRSPKKLRGSYPYVFELP